MHIGKTPLELKASELLARVQSWEHKDRAAAEKADPADAYETPQGRSRRRYGWCPIHLRGNTQTKLYFKVDLNGMPGFSELAESRHESVNTPDEHWLLTLDTVFPPWEEEIEKLLDKARLSDYQVDVTWQTAFESYGQFGKRQLERALPQEPELRRVAEARVPQKYELQQVTDSESAWRLLMQICDDAGEAKQWNSASDAGIAVDLLLPHLDQKQLVQHAATLLEKHHDYLPGDRWWSGQEFATHGDNHGAEVSLWPIAQAIWRLDQHLDREFPDPPVDVVKFDAALKENGFPGALTSLPYRDNIVEQTLTPLLLRQGYTGSSRVEYAEMLGGSEFDLFALRNDWQTPATDAFNGVTVGSFENYVNKWYHKLMWLKSPIGVGFRHAQTSDLINIASRGLREGHSAGGQFPNELDFLFLDRTWSNERPSLAMRFRDEAANYARQKTEGVFQLEFRWKYLLRLWPESTTDQFAAALNETLRSGNRLYNAPVLPAEFPAEARFEILSTMIAAEQIRIADLPDDRKDDYDGPKRRSQQVLNSMIQQMYHLPCETAAQRLLDDMAADPDHSWWGRLPGFLKFDTTHDELLWLIVNGGDERLQLMALPAIEHHPTVLRQSFLDELLQSNNPKVASSAADVRLALNELLAKAPSRRQPIAKTN